MRSNITAVLVTADLARLQAFYTELLDAVEEQRVPEEGPTFYVGMLVGDSRLGLVSDDGASTDAGQRILLSIDVDDVDGLLPRVEDLGGRVLGPPNDMPWGQRVAHIEDPDRNAVNLTRAL
jgi:predicted enzyme related to lactoylglutathione lyase